MRGITRRADRNRSRRAIVLFGAALTAGSIAINSMPASASLVMRYTYDEASGSVTNVANPGTYTGSLLGGVTRSSVTPGGSPGNSALSPGNPGTYVEAANNGVNDPLDVAPGSLITMTTWFRMPVNPTRNDALISNFGFEGALVWYIDRNNVNVQPTVSNFTVRMDAKQDPGSSNLIYSTAKSADITLGAADKWLFLAATYDGSGGGGGLVRFYVGDESTAVFQSGADTAFGGLPKFSGSEATLKIGAKNTADNGGLEPNAYFDDTRVYIGDFMNASQLDAVRLENLTGGVPEPATAGVLAVGAASLLLGRVRRAAPK